MKGLSCFVVIFCVCCLPKHHMKVQTKALPEKKKKGGRKAVTTLGLVFGDFGCWSPLFHSYFGGWRRHVPPSRQGAAAGELKHG